jgi:S1-C subfamily serine protease
LVGYGSPEGKPIQEYKGTIEKVYVKTKITNGCSGGPIMDANGFLIGMITAKTSEGSQAVLISAEKVWDLVQKFLKEIK